MAKLTKYEKETIILFNEGEDTANIYTYNASLRKRLALFSKKHPDLCKLEKSHEQGGVTYGTLTGTCRFHYENVECLFCFPKG